MPLKPPSAPPQPSSWRTHCKTTWTAIVARLSRKRPTPVSETLPLTALKTAVADTAAAEKTDAPASSAETARAYRHDAATHLYACNAARIHAGMLAPQLYAIGVLNVSIGQAGEVLRLHWLRAPDHAPEVVAEIERTVHAAAPFPRPLRLGKVVYTDTWLWNASGSFQLDTLTEGQL